MAAKIIFLCASALFVQNALSQCLNSYGLGINNLAVNPVGYNTIGLANSALLGGVGYGLGSVGYGLGSVGYGLGGVGYGLDVVGPNYGAGLIGYPNLGAIGSSGPLPVSTISPIGPSGLAVASENAIEGIVQVSGTLPFLSAVAFEGALPTAGSGVATCGCGNGAVGILSEGFPGPIGGCGCGASALYPSIYY